MADQAVQIHILKEVNEKSGEPVCTTTGCKDECARWHWKSGSGLSGAGTREDRVIIAAAGRVWKAAMRKEVVELSGKHPRYGYRRITALMRREGFEVNGKRVARIRREEGIKVSKNSAHEAARDLDGRAAAR